MGLNIARKFATKLQYERINLHEDTHTHEPICVSSMRWLFLFFPFCICVGSCNVLNWLLVEYIHELHSFMYNTNECVNLQCVFLQSWPYVGKFAAAICALMRLNVCSGLVVVCVCDVRTVYCVSAANSNKNARLLSLHFTHFTLHFGSHAFYFLNSQFIVCMRAR